MQKLTRSFLQHKKREMAGTAQTIQDYSKQIDWEKLKDDYSRLMMDREVEVEIEPQESRRRLTDRSLKKTKGKKRVPVMDYSSIHLKASSKKKGKSNKYSSMQNSSKSKSGRGKGKGVDVPTISPAPSKFKSGKSSKKKHKKKCRKISVPVDSHEARRQRRTKASTSMKAGSAKSHETNSQGDRSLKVYKKKIKGKKVAKKKKKKYESSKGGSKGKGKSASKSKSVKSPKLSKSGKHKFVVVCDDDEAPSQAPSAAPSDDSSSMPSTSPMPTTGTISPSPSTSPSISHAPSLSNEPTEFGRTSPPSLIPSLSLSPSNQPSSRPSEQPSLVPTSDLLPTKSPLPTISAAPTLEDIYRYDSGNCPNNGSLNVPCSDPNLRKICDRYNDEFGSFRRCWELCTPSFCCIHDARNNFEAPSCSLDENCAQYAYCYIVWFKFHDTFGPATYLDVEQEGNFFDVNNTEVRGDDKFGEDFFDQLYFHHFDDVAEKIQFGTVDGDFVPAVLFEDTAFWQEEGKGLETV